MLIPLLFLFFLFYVVLIGLILKHIQWNIDLELQIYFFSIGK